MIKSIHLILLLELLYSINLYSQKDTIKEKPYDEYKAGIRTGIGYQSAFNLEIGFSYHKAYGDLIVSPQATCFYSSIELFPLENKLFGFKIGIEQTGHLLVGGAELKYLSDFKNGTIIFTPKIGFGLWGMINIFYGYNLMSENNYLLNNISNNQFSIIINIDGYLRYLK